MLENCWEIIYKIYLLFIPDAINLTMLQQGLTYEQTCSVTLEHNLPMTMGFEDWLEGL